jgi:4-hydroxy-tetrahydrodipicolinate synthase
MKENQFIGTGTALVTPFTEAGGVDFFALKFQLERQIEGGVQFLVPCGTTGESPTQTHDEHKLVMKFVIEEAAGRVPVLVGTGSNSTDEAVALTKAAKEFGADGALVVMPYYNKPTKAGIMDYYRQVAKVGRPVVLYDIPGRCGGAMISAKTVLDLAQEGTIVGLKWASGNLDQLQEVLAGRPKGFKVFSGDDNLTYPAMGLGADGVISVVSNLIPKLIAKFVADSRLGSGFSIEACRQHYSLLQLMKAMFIETNPIPVKTALAMMYPKTVKEVFRSPLVGMEESNRKVLWGILKWHELVEGGYYTTTPVCI